MLCWLKTVVVGSASRSALWYRAFNPEGIHCGAAAPRGSTVTSCRAAYRIRVVLVGSVGVGRSGVGERERVARRQDVRRARPGRLDRLTLVMVQPQRRRIPVVRA